MTPSRTAVKLSGALALMSGDEQFRAWAEIDYSIQTGRMAFEKVYGKPIFDYLGENPDKARIFDAAMVGIHGRESALILSAYDFRGIDVLADIGPSNRIRPSDRSTLPECMSERPVRTTYRAAAVPTPLTFSNLSCILGT